jgi:hypothetical protein
VPPLRGAKRPFSKLVAEPDGGATQAPNWAILEKKQKTVIEKQSAAAD